MYVCVCGPGELPGEVVTVISNPEGLQQLVNLPAGSVRAELDRVIILIQVYQYLETTSNWDALGADSLRNSAKLRQKIKEGEEMKRRLLMTMSS